jgi:hypothetical protein
MKPPKLVLDFSTRLCRQLRGQRALRHRAHDLRAPAAGQADFPLQNDKSDGRVDVHARLLMQK